MGGGRPDHDRHVAHPDPAVPVPGDRAVDAEPAAGLPEQLGEPGARGNSVDLVVEREHTALRAPVGPYGPGEDDDRPGPAPTQIAGGPFGGEPPADEPELGDHPPPYGGWTANSSPGRIVVARSAR